MSPSYNHVLVLLVLLIPLCCTSTGFEKITDPNDVIGNMKDLLNREREKLTNTSLKSQDTNHKNSSLIPDDDIVGQLISLFNCGPFPISPNSHLHYFLDYQKRDLKLFQACNRYFQMTAKPKSLRVRCENNRWIFDRINCERTTCPRLTAPHGGHISTDDNTYNTTVYFWCSSGFSLNGSGELLCKESGFWDSTPPICEVSICPPLAAPLHGFVSSHQGTPTNETVEFGCENLYFINGDAVLRCQQDGRWNNTAPVCKKMCIVPDLGNRSEGVLVVPDFKLQPIGSLHTQGQRAIFTCKSGYTPLKFGSTICIGGKWRPLIQCKKTCTAIEIANGKYVLSKNSSIVEYSCLSGYQLIGKQKLTCTSELTWDGKPPICTKLCTLKSENKLVLSFRRKPDYESIPFGTRITNGSRVYFICRSRAGQVINETTCYNETLSPPPCQTKLVNDMLEIYFEGSWRKICTRSEYACRLLGYRDDPHQYRSCSERCYILDERIFKDSLKIVLYQYNHVRECLACSAPKR